MIDKELIAGVRARLERGDKARILFVCLGNICRSPAAQGVFESMAAERGVASRLDVDSCGFYGGHAGDLPDRRMRTHAFARGYRLEHRSRVICPSDFEYFDLIIGMDDRNIANLRDAAPTPGDERKIMRMADLAVHYPEATYVPDPYYEGAEGFELVLNLLEDGCAELLNLLFNPESK